MIYAKNNYVPLTHNRYEQQFEYCFLFSKGKPKTFNPIKVPCKEAGRVKRINYVCANSKEKGAAVRSGELREGDNNEMIIKNDKIGPNIWFYSVGARHSAEEKCAYKHPAVFPERLVSNQISSWSNENELIYDCFMGSGTVAKIAKRLKRNYIGSELNPEYQTIWEERLLNA